MSDNEDSALFCTEEFATQLGYEVLLLKQLLREKEREAFELIFGPNAKPSEDFMRADPQGSGGMIIWGRKDKSGRITLNVYR